MNLSLLTLFIFISVLIACQWQDRIYQKPVVNSWILWILVGCLDLLIVYLLRNQERKTMLRYLWIRIAIISVIPILLLRNERMSKVELIGSGLVIAGVTLLLVHDE